jgi:hypothetical protein
MKRWLAGIALLGFAIAVPANAAILIDPFEEARFSLFTNTFGGPSVTQPGLSSVWGGTRFAQAFRYGDTGTAEAVLDPDTPDVLDDGIVFGVGANSSAGIYLIYHGGAGSTNTDLAADGSDRFVVMLGPSASTGDLIIELRSPGKPGILYRFLPIAGPGSYEFLYTDFRSSDEFFGFSNIDLIHLQLSAEAGSAPLSYSIMDFRTSGGAIPEPSTLIVWSLLGGLAITVGWRCRISGQHSSPPT